MKEFQRLPQLVIYPDEAHPYGKDLLTKDKTLILRTLVRNNFRTTVGVLKEAQARVGSVLFKILCNGKELPLTNNDFDLAPLIKDEANRFEFVTFKYEHLSVNIPGVGDTTSSDQPHQPDALDKANSDEPIILYDSTAGKLDPK